jgi:hypothetical protein
VSDGGGRMQIGPRPPGVKPGVGPLGLWKPVGSRWFSAWHFDLQASKHVWEIEAVFRGVTSQRREAPVKVSDCSTRTRRKATGLPSGFRRTCALTLWY